MNQRPRWVMLVGAAICAAGIFSFAGALRASDDFSRVVSGTQEQARLGRPLEPAGQAILLGFLSSKHEQVRRQLALGLVAVACGLHLLSLRRAAPQPVAG